MARCQAELAAVKKAAKGKRSKAKMKHVGKLLGKLQKCRKGH